MTLPTPQPDWAYFLDLDGTLLDLADPLGGGHVDPQLRALIEKRYRAAGGALAVISGRSIADLDVRLGFRLPLAGQHGVERRDAAGRITRHAFPTAALAAARHALAEAAARRPGLDLEDKGLTLALHYRRAPRLRDFAIRLMHELEAPLAGRYCVQRGKGIVELKPAGRDKGEAVVEFMQETPFRGRKPVFVGDDLTDEYGFRAVTRLGGYAIKVGPGRTTAAWRLPDVAAVRAWLDGVLEPR